MIAPSEPDTDFAVYPDADGKPVADNTLQLRWITTLQGNLDAIFRHRDDVFVAGDNLIYPVRGNPTISQAPDVYVAFGRPKGDRGSYKVWEEGGTFPQVIWEVLSPSNTVREMQRKRRFYRRYGAEEYFVYDPETGEAEGWTRDGRRFVDVDDLNGWVSPRLGVRFETGGPELVLYRPDGSRFLTFDQLDQLVTQERERAAAADQRAAEEQKRAEAAEAKAARLLAKLRAAGLDPNGE
jgi:Uma2 family endonuclease